MKLVSKSLLGCAVLGSVMTLTACQNMGMNQSHTSNHHQMTTADKKTVALTEGQVVKILSVANNGEIMQAKAALPKLQTPQARNFAQGMIEKHTANEMKGQALAKRMGVMPQASQLSNALQNDSNKMVTKLSKTSAPVDKQYIADQVKIHSKVLQTIDSQLLPNAKNAELRNFLVETRSAVAMHLKVAQQLHAAM